MQDPVYAGPIVPDLPQFIPAIGLGPCTLLHDWIDIHESGYARGWAAPPPGAGAEGPRESEPRTPAIYGGGTNLPKTARLSRRETTGVRSGPRRPLVYSAPLDFSAAPLSRITGRRRPHASHLRTGLRGGGSGFPSSPISTTGSSPEVSVISSKEGKHSPHRSMATTSSLSHSR